MQKAEVKEIFVVSEPGSIYELRLRLSVNKSVCFTGYTDKRQFGQYYTLTLNNSLTRLYTSVHCLQKRNLSLMETLIKGFTRFQKNLTVNNKQNENIELANDRPSISPMNIVDHGEQDTS